MKIPILHIPEFEKQEPLRDFYSNSFREHVQNNQHLLQKPHSHDFYLCVLFTHGRGRHEIDFSTYPIGRGSVFFLKPGQSHFWEFEEPPQGYIFFHTGDFYNLHFLKHKLNSLPFYASDQNPPMLQLNSEKLQQVSGIFRELHAEYLKQERHQRLKLANLLSLAYIEMAREYSSIKVDSISSPASLKILRALEGLIEEHFRREKSAAFFSDRLSITPKHLNRVTKTTLNKTTTELITERVVLEAKRLIVHSTESLSQIGLLLGYTDYSYFSKVFKANTGSSPLEFKRRYQSKKSN